MDNSNPSEQSVGGEPEAGGTIYVDLRGGRGKRTKKRRYSKNVKDVQKASRHLNRGLDRIAGAVHDGVRQWRKDWDRSAAKKRDGAIKDAPENITRALAVTARRSSWAPVDVAKALRKTRLYRQVVKALTRF